MKYFFEYPEELGFPPLFGATRCDHIDSYNQGVACILEWVLIEDPRMGGVSVEGAVEELRKLLGELRITKKFTLSFPSWQSDFKTLCYLWSRIGSLQEEALELGISSLSPKLITIFYLLREGKIEEARSKLIMITDHLRAGARRYYDPDD